MSNNLSYTTELNSEIRRVLRRIRDIEYHGNTAAMASAIGVHSSSVCNWIAGRSNIRPGNLTRIKNKLGMDIGSMAQRNLNERQDATPEPQKVTVPTVEVERSITLRTTDDGNEIVLNLTDHGLTLKQGDDTILFSDAAHFLAFTDAVRKVASI